MFQKFIETKSFKSFTKSCVRNFDFSTFFAMPPPTESISKVVVHPLVLLSVVDHFNRVSTAGSQRRVVGVLLGANRKGILDVSNSFAGNGR